MEIQYIFNDGWETTNNVVSLAMATPSLKRDFILLEGDLIFKWEAFEKMLGPNRIAVDRFQPNMDGTVVSIDEKGCTDRFYLKSTHGRPSNLTSYYKTVNIYSFDFKNYTSAVVPRLQHLIESGQDQLYYEQAIADAIDDQDLKLECVLFSG
jgi:CTP:phosphocholine cytidylyltransferase-like protein